MEQAVILAAGEGQRLRPFTASKPKVMIPIANKPILRYVIESAAVNGVRKILVVVGYRKDQVIDYFGAGEQFGVDIDYIEQKQQLGTAHALKQVKDRVNGMFLTLSGDNIIEPETIAELTRAKVTTILVKEQEFVSKYGVIEAQDGAVTSIIEKPREALSHLVNTGIYAFGDDIFDQIDQETDLTSVILNMIGLGQEVRVCEATGDWLDVVYPWDMLRLNDSALANISPSTGGSIENGVNIKGLVSVGEGTIIRSNSYIVGPVTIGKNCEIGPSVCVLPSTSIGDTVCISPFTTIDNSILADGVEIGASSHVQDSIIDRGCRVKGHFITQSDETEIRIDDEYHRVQIGAMPGEHCIIGSNVVASSGIIIGNRSRIMALRTLETSIPDESLLM
ncbi:MAG: NTP transferase domain-containing protein [Dehalococcoidia bacterium]|nr:MAG: NTP transferase domain-containing protein [Dehalococcoidia bacterium]